MRRLLFAVIDGVSPDQLRRAVAEDRAPFLARLMAGSGLKESVAAFPSVTPVCATALATGVRQDAHRIPGMNWWDRSRERYVEYGSSFAASRRLGISRQLADTVYHLNGRHLAPEVGTIFERLDDLGVRTAGTTYLVYRGRYRHEIAKDTTMGRLVAQVFRRPVQGPRELFYGDLFASRPYDCRSQYGMPGLRDQHAGCVGANLVRDDLVEFLLLSLPDNDTNSHKHGPDAQVETISAADAQLVRVADAAGGIDRFLDEWAVVVASDHGHALVERSASIRPALEDFGIVGPSGRRRRDRIALCPNSRAAMAYVLDPEDREHLVPRIVAASRASKGVELAVWRSADGDGVIGAGDDGPAEGELRFRPGTALADERGGRWDVDGNLALIGGRVEDGVLRSDSHPDALGRCWSALTCPTSGDVLLSAVSGAEFPDWGEALHMGGGSHGSLRAEDATGILLVHGLHDAGGRPVEPERAAWSIEDPVPLIMDHFLSSSSDSAPTGGDAPDPTGAVPR